MLLYTDDCCKESEGPESAFSILYCRQRGKEGDETIEGEKKEIIYSCQHFFIIGENTVMNQIGN